MPNSTQSLSWANTECTIQIIYIPSALVCVCWANIISAGVFEYLWIMQRLTHPSRARKWLRSSDSLSTRPKWMSTSCSVGTPTPSARDRFSCTQIQTHPTTDYQPKACQASLRRCVWPPDLCDGAVSSHGALSALRWTFDADVDRFRDLTIILCSRLISLRTWHFSPDRAERRKRIWTEEDEERTWGGRGLHSPGSEERVSRWLSRKLCQLWPDCAGWWRLKSTQRYKSYTFFKCQFMLCRYLQGQSG